MSIEAMKWAMEQEISPSGAKFILLCLCDYAGKKTDLAFPSIETLCKKTSQDRKTVISGLDKLCDLGFIEEIGAFPGGVKQYRIIGLPDEDNHYVYRVFDTRTGEFYIGARSRDGDVNSDYFFGGSRWIQEKGRENLSREILGIYTTRKEAELTETFLVNSFRKSAKLKNKFLPREKDVPKTAPVPKTVPVPKTGQGSTENGTSRSTENGTGVSRKRDRVVPKTVHRTINKPLVEPLEEPLSKGTDLIAPDESGAPEEPKSISTQVWDAYNTAYFNRYGTETIRDALANTHISRFIACVGKKEAPHIAAFYVSINKQYYISRYHDLGDLVKDAKGIRTQWVTGRVMTNTKAAQMDGTATNADAVKEAMEIWKRRNGHAHV